MNFKKLDLTLYVSAFLLALGVFLPLTHLAVYGDVSYNRVAPTESYLVIGFALAGAVLAMLSMPKYVRWAPAGVWLTLLFPAIKGLFEPEDDSFLSGLTDQASGVLQEFAGDLFMNIFEFSWGGYVFLVGLLVFTASALMLSFKKRQA